METSIVTIEQLSHRYTAAWAIRDINMEIRQRGIVGLLGSNGAGKSTTMNILCGALRPTSGKVCVNGTDMGKEPYKAKQQIGFLPQSAPLYLDLTVDEYLAYCAGLRQMDKKAIRAAMDEVKERCGISHVSSRLLRNLSGGYRQRVGIAQAIMHKPPLVVLDEPTNGLDPNQIKDVRALIKEIAADRAVIFSSHILSEVQLLCKDVIMIESGKIVFADTMHAFNNYVEPHSIILHMHNPPPMETILEIPGVTKAELITDQRFRLFFNGDQSITERVIRTSVLQDWGLREISLEKSSVDEVFAKLSNKNPQQSN